MTLELNLVIAFMLGGASGVVGLTVASRLVRKAIEEGVKQEIAKLLGHAATIANASIPKVAPVVLSPAQPGAVPTVQTFVAPVANNQ